MLIFIFFLTFIRLRILDVKTDVLGVDKNSMLLVLYYVGTKCIFKLKYLRLKVSFPSRVIYFEIFQNRDGKIFPFELAKEGYETRIRQFLSIPRIGIETALVD